MNANLLKKFKKVTIERNFQLKFNSGTAEIYH